MIETAFRAILTGSDLATALATGGVHFNAAPQNERRPRVILTKVSHVRYHDFDGRVGYSDGEFQVDCFAPTYPQAKELAAAVRAALDAAEGCIDGTDIGWIECQDERDVPAAPLAGQATPTYGVSISARFLIDGDE